MLDDPKAREKLLRARAEIEEILKRHDIGAFVVLHAAPSSAEVIMHLEPSYSVIKVGKRGDVRIKSLLSDYNGDAEAQRYDMAATANMASTLFELGGRGAINLGQISEVIDRESGAGHSTITQIKPN